MFIFFIFVFSIVKSEEPKIKLIKIKEFSSYEEYERWKGKVKKPPRIIVDKGVIKFYDSKGRVIKEKRYRYMSEDDWKKVYEEYERSGEDIKSMQIYSEYAKVLPNDKGVLLIKTTTYYGRDDAVYEIYDDEGKIKGEIKVVDDEFIYPAPDASYFIGIKEDVDWVDNVFRVYDGNGKLIFNEKVYDFYGNDCQIIFSDDSRYAVISIVEWTKKYGSGIIVYDRNNNKVWKVFNKEWEMISESGVVLSSTKGIILGTNKGVYRFSFDGKQIWYNEETKANYEDKEKVGSVSILSISSDEKDIVGYAWPGIIYVIDVENGDLIKRILLPNHIRYKGGEVQIINRYNYFLYKSRGFFELTPKYEEIKYYMTAYLMDKKDNFLWKVENADVSINAELTENEELLVKDKEKIYLYKIQEEKR